MERKATKKLYVEIDIAYSGVKKAIDALQGAKTDDIIANDIASIIQELEHQGDRLSEICNIAYNDNLMVISEKTAAHTPL